jgi:hypothetical protein
MNLGQLRTDTYNRMGVSTTDAMLTTPVVNQFINDAKDYVATVHDWPWQQVMPVTFSTTVGVADYTPPADWLRTVDLRVTSPTTFTEGMALYSPMELDDRWPQPLTGQPREYAIFGDHIRLGPTPDSVYTVSHRYIRVEPDLVLDPDTPIMPAQFTPCLADYAAFLGLRTISEEQRATVCLNAFQQWIQIMLQDRRRSTAPQRVRVRPGNLV